MADNIDVTPGAGKTVATDEVTIDGALVQVQRVKPTFGVAGTAVDVSASNPLPVTQTGAIPAGANAIGSVSVTGSVAVTGTFWQATQPVSGTVAATQSGTWNIGTVTAVTTITNPVAATQSGTWNITNVSGTVTLPTGASTAALQTTGNATLVNIETALNTPATQLPKTPLLDPTDLLYVFNSSSASTTRSLVAAVASQTTRGYRMAVSAAAATTLTFTDGSGGATLYTVEFPAAGAYVFDLDSRAYFETTANTALHVISSAAVKTTVALFYVTSV